MPGLKVVFLKELNDHFSSKRFIIIFLLICLIATAATYIAWQGLHENLTSSPAEYVFLRLFTTTKEGFPSFVSFLAFFGPLMGIVLGFDAINSEFSQGTVSRILAQPIYRDAWINGKFLAGFITLGIIFTSIVLIMIGFGVWMLGFPPQTHELIRIGLFIIMSTFYVGFWLSLGILFSIFFRRSVSSALASIAVWIFFSFFIYMLAGIIADQLAPIGPKSTAEVWIKHQHIKDVVVGLSPATIFSEAIYAILIPTYRGIGFATLISATEIPTSPLSMGQSLLIVWPEVVGLIAMTLICFAISYIVFMKKEIRA